MRLSHRGPVDLCPAGERLGSLLGRRPQAGLQRPWAHSAGLLTAPQSQRAARIGAATHEKGPIVCTDPVLDTGVLDTGVRDTAVLDTAALDTAALDTAVRQALLDDAAALTAAATDLAPGDRADRLPAICEFFAGYSAVLLTDPIAPDGDGLRLRVDRLRVALDAVGDERTEFASAKARTVHAARRLADDLAERNRVGGTGRDALGIRLACGASLEFLVPWLFDRMPALERDRALLTSPREFRTVYDAHARAYRRLARSLRVAGGSSALSWEAPSWEAPSWKAPLYEAPLNRTD